MRVLVMIAGLLALLVWFRPPHAVLKLVTAEPLPTLERYESPRRSATNRGVLVDAPGDHELLVSDITLWEIALLVGKQRIKLGLPVREWLERATAPPLVRRCSLSPAVVSETLRLPEDFHGDPADRIIVSTARVHGATLVTRDRRILASGLVDTL